MTSRQNDDPLAKAAEAFDAWRSRKDRGKKIPEALWELVKPLDNHYPRSLLLKRLRISSTQYRQHVLGILPRVSSPQPSKSLKAPRKTDTRPMAFAEVTMNQTAMLNALSSPLVFTLERPDGCKFTGHYQQTEQLLQLVKGFLGES